MYKKNLLFTLILTSFFTACSTQQIAIYQQKDIKMNKNETTILVVEFQKTWTEKSLFYSLIKSEYEGRNVYENSIKLLNIARANGINIIQSPFIIDKNDKVSYDKVPFLPKFLGQFTANTWRAKYTKGIFKDGDYEVKGRTAFDNTIDSTLLTILKDLNIKTVYIMGFTTDHCVSETFDSLTKLGYQVVMIKDATASILHSAQIAMEKKYNTISSQELIDKISK